MSKIKILEDGLIHLMCMKGDLHDVDDGQCIGEMTRFGPAIGTPPRYEHKCQYCGHTETKMSEYPRDRI